MMAWTKQLTEAEMKKEIKFTAILEGGKKKELDGKEVNAFIKDEKREYKILDSEGKPIFVKSFKG
jgi:hypothetical protein